MANPKHLEIARQGKDAWNKWRAENPDEPADFLGTDFTLPENQNISFAGFKFGNKANFKSAVLGDRVSFERAAFGLMAYFDGAAFGGWASFEGAAFGNEASFRGAMFGPRASFDGAVFGDGASFAGAAFGDEASFEGAVFGDGAYFKGAAFGDQASFEGAVFGSEAFFEGAVFGDGASFDGAAFGDEASFEAADFGRWTFFRGMARDRLAAFRTYIEKGFPEETKARLVELREHADPEGFSRINFTGAKFHGQVSFENRAIRERAIFAHARFAQPPDFSAVENKERLDLIGARFGFRGQGIPNWTTDSEVADNLRRLRKIASDLHATDAERDLFILERKAERGISGKRWLDSWKSQKNTNWRNYDWTERLFGWWRPLSAIVLLFFYSVLSNCGRSVAWPVVWFVVFNFLGFFNVYRSLAQKPHCCDAYSYLTFSGVLSLTEWPLISNPVCDSVLSFTLANLIPFGEMNKTMLEKSTVALFEKGTIPLMVHFATLAQGATNTLLVFLLVLALRNHFKVK